MKVTDKMRLDWLIKTGHRILSHDGVWWVGTVGSWGETGTLIEGDAAYKDHPRKAIDAAIRQEEKNG